MRHEPIELGLTGTSGRRRGTRRVVHGARRSMAPTKEKCGATAVEVVDEAFAGLARVEPHRLEMGLIAKLSAQLDALDRQREQLSQLLRNIDADKLSR